MSHLIQTCRVEPADEVDEPEGPSGNRNLCGRPSEGLLGSRIREDFFPFQGISSPSKDISSPSQKTGGSELRGRHAKKIRSIGLSLPSPRRARPVRLKLVKGLKAIHVL